VFFGTNFMCGSSGGGLFLRNSATRSGNESDDVANYVFPKTWPHDREQRARIIGEWLQAEARFLA
jgi:hypothetical protein